MKKLVVLLVLAMLGVAEIAQGGSLYQSYMRRQNLAGAQRRYNSTHSGGVPSYSRNYPKPVPRKDFFLPPSQRMELDRKIKARQWHQEQFPSSNKRSELDFQWNVPVYNKDGTYSGAVTQTRSGTQLYRNLDGEIESRSTLNRDGSRAYYGPDGSFQGRIDYRDDTSTMERFLQGVND